MQFIYFIKKNILLVVAIIVLTTIQAIGIIMLPEYISKIVDTGIQKKGIEYSVPKIIRKSEMDKLMIFINDESVLSNFEIVNQKEDIKDRKEYENLTFEEPIYIEKENIDRLNLNYTFARAITLLQIMNNDEAIVNIREKVSTNVTKEIRMALGGSSVKEVLESLDRTQLNNVNKMIDEKITVLTEDIFDQISANYLIKEYEKLGIIDIQTKYIAIAGIQMILIAIIVLISYILGDYLTITLSAKLGKDMRKRIFDHIVDMEEYNFDKFTITTLINRSVYDVQIIQQTIPLIIKMLIFIPVISIGSIIKINEMSNFFPNSLIIAAIAIVAIGTMACAFILPKISKIQKELDRINSIVRDSLKNIFIARGSGKNKQEKKFDNANNIIFTENKRVMNSKIGSVILMQLIIYILSIYILWRGGLQIDQGSLMLGALMAIIEYLFQISFSVISILRNFMSIFKGIISLKRYKEVLKIEILYDTNCNIVDKIDSIEFKNVYFRYPETKKYILKNFNTTINAKDKVSITGKNGVGKSTIWKILLGLYPIDKGEILINNINIKEINLHSLRNKISVVSQRNDILSGNINLNIAFENTNIDRKKIMKLRDIVRLTEFGNENREVSYKGKNISGGQKQRIAIARLLATDADVYIFDDAFSSIDQETKNIIKRNLNTFCKEKTIINIEQNNNDNWIYNKHMEL